jgi:hypothetical protein
VAKIKNRIDKTELPSICKKEAKDEGIERGKEREGGLNEFVAVLKKTLRGCQEEEKKLEKEFGAVMGRGNKEKKKSCKMLYQSLGEVRKNIAAIESKNKNKGRRML